MCRREDFPPYDDFSPSCGCAGGAYGHIDSCPNLPTCTCTAKSLNPCGHMDECPLYRDPVEVYGTPEHEFWLMEMEARGDYQ